MKSINYMLGLILGAATFVACSDDDAPDKEVVESNPITTSVDTLEVGVGETASFTIDNGGGDYNIFTENADIVTSTLENNTVTVVSQAKGITGVVISDAAGDYKRVLVKSMYKSLELDKEQLDIGMKLGHSGGLGYITVTQGNGNYTVKVADESIAVPSSVSGNLISIAGKATGTTTVTITDMMGLQVTIPVNVEVSEEPYTDEEKAIIIQKYSENTLVWDGELIGNYGKMTLTKENGKNLFYWDYYSYYYIKVFFDGDLSVGTVTGGTMETRTWNGKEDYENVKVEILKNDGTRIWAVMSTIKNDYLYYGFFSIAL